ncbi:hypothetical protein A8G00_21200 [Sphingobium sp. SA916]|nr:hypothetical protein A8G00_21200 [Sphingobium sp. SA916]
MAPQSDADSAQGNNGVQDIVVTAQRIGESLQKVPIAVTALTADAISDRGITGSSALEAVVPNLSMSRIGGVNQPFLRGVGSDGAGGFDEKSVATYVDGFYIAAPSSTQLSFNNIQRLEVLKGPQGTLFGRNATGGVIQVVTKDPTQDPHAEFDVGYGNYSTVDANAYVTGGIAQGLAADLAVQYHNQDDGFGTNLITGRDVNKDRTISLRSKWVYTGDTTKITLFGSYDKGRSCGFCLQFQPGSAFVTGAGPLGRYDVRMTKEPYFRTKNIFAGLRIEQELGFATFVSSTLYGDNDLEYYSDIATQSPPYVSVLGVVTHEKAKEYAQEFQLLGESGPLKWQVGTYLFRYDYNIFQPFDGAAFSPVPGPFITQSDGRKDSVSVYGQGTYALTDELKFTAGIRYTYDKVETDNSKIDFQNTGIVNFADRKITSKKPTWRLALDYQVTPEILTYVSYNRGIKTGGLSVNDFTSSGYAPEQLDAYEVGLKANLFDRAVRFNAAGFYYDYKNLQVSIASSSAAIILNAATARVYGLDVDLEVRPVKNFSVSVGLGLLDSKYKKFVGAPSVALDGTPSVVDVSGNRSINAPKISGSVTATYEIPTSVGDFKVSGTVTHKGKAFPTPDNLNPYPEYTLVNALIGWTSSDGNLGVELWGRNLTDRTYYAIRVPIAGFGQTQVASPPRTYGVRLKAKF